MKLRATKTIALSASKAGMRERTARKYLKCGHLPSELKKQRSWRTRENPFVEVWPEQTAKANDLEPYWYLRYLFEQLPYIGRDTEKLRQLLPMYVNPEAVKKQP